MFETAMLDSSSRARAQRRWANLLSVIVQIVLIGALLLLPVIPESIPQLRFTERILAPPAHAAEPIPPSTTAGGAAHHTPRPEELVLQQPSSVPEHITTGEPEVPGPPSLHTTAGSCVGRCGGSPFGVPGGVGPYTGFVPTVRQPDPAPARVALSGGVTQGMLIHRVQPVYPPMAKQAGVHGQVVLRAVISKSGEIQELRVVSGHPWLSRAAMDAVRQWRYQPYLLSGAPVEVETQVTVNFVLSGR